MKWQYQLCLLLLLCGFCVFPHHSLAAAPEVAGGGTIVDGNTASVSIGTSLYKNTHWVSYCFGIDSCGGESLDRFDLVPATTTSFTVLSVFGSIGPYSQYQDDLYLQCVHSDVVDYDFFQSSSGIDVWDDIYNYDGIGLPISFSQDMYVTCPAGDSLTGYVNASGDADFVAVQYVYGSPILNVYGATTTPIFTQDSGDIVFGLSIIIFLLAINFMAAYFHFTEFKKTKSNTLS